MRTTLIKKLSTIALSRLDQQEALRSMLTKVSASGDNKTSTSSGGKIPLQSHKNLSFSGLVHLYSVSWYVRESL